MQNPASRKGDLSQKGSKKTVPQIQDEPFEIAQDAWEQITRSAPPPAESASEQSGTQQPKESPQERRKQSRLQALQEEIKELQDRRQQEMRARREPSEEEQPGQPEEQPLVEPEPKRKRGMLGGDPRATDLAKKQRQVEMPKTPTN